jgi:hypothetical protein
LALAMAISLLAVSSASAAASYVFEPTLSLTGDCSTSKKLDPVPDPGLCPIPPGVPGKDHPSARLEAASVTIDSYGDVYVANMLGEKGRVDVFAPDGTFITEFADTAGPQSLAVDAKGNVYLYERTSGSPDQIRRFPPKIYKPEEGEIEYGEEPVVLANDKTKPVIPLSFESSLALEPSSQRLYVDTSSAIAVFGSAEEENKLLEKEAISGLQRSQSIAVDAKHKRIYVSDEVPITVKSTVRIFELEAPYKELGKINGSTTPKGEFLSGEGNLQLDVDEETGHLFVGDLAAANKVYEFEEDGNYLATIEHSFEVAVGPGGVPGEIAVDNGPKSPRPQKEAWLFVPSVASPSPGHVYAFEPNEEGPPIIESTSVGDVTETEATLHATINPGGLETTYRLEYVSRQQFEASGFAEATLAGEGTLPKGAEGVAVSASATELAPGTEYRFRAIAENSKGEDEEEKAFTTFPAEEKSEPCANETLRTGLSALLPDCRAYELVTPGDTNGRPPSGVGISGVYFPTLEASPDGNRASFLIEGGLIPGNEGAGAFNGDLYLTTRTAEGWISEVTGPSGKEVVGPQPGSVSPDQTYSFWEDARAQAVYIRYPDGHSELVGRGSLGEDPTVNAQLITENGAHIIFGTTNFGGHVAQQLEPSAPPEGTAAIYDRSAEGPTHVVSLLPGNITPAAKEGATYLGASEEGEGIAFEIGGTIYLRLDNEETFEVAGPAATFAGVAAKGTRVFYIEGGDLFAFDAEGDETIAFSESGDVTPVNVATGGTRAYLASPSVLTGEPNPNGEEAEGGAENLYLSEEGTISFVGVVTKRDVEGEKRIDGQVGGLGLWIEGLKFNAPSIDPSRTTPSGTTLLFESRADLTEFESGSFAQVYRYDSAQSRLSCLSCSPPGTPPTSDASLQSIAESQPSLIPASSHAKIANQSPDGKRAFFQTAEPLVVGDTDELLDVYEWEEEGVGSCETEGGCVYLISGGQSSSPDFLFAMSQSGDDVFFRTADILLPRDKETTLSIYDARVGGGEPEPEPEIECEGEGCHPHTTPPTLLAPAEPTPGAEDQVVERKHCPKGKRLVKRHGKEVCVKKHKKKHHRRAGTHKRRGAR